MPETRHAVFIEPSGEVRDLLLDWKRRIAERWPGASFVSHPPHATIWVGELNDPDRARASVANAIERAPREPIRLSGPHVFFDDRQANGGQTLVFAAPLTPSLAALQHAIHTALQPFIAADYPFTGPGWIPHFSVASLPVARDHDIVRAFSAVPAPALSTACTLGWWRIEGEQHDKVTAL